VACIEAHGAMRGGDAACELWDTPDIAGVGRLHRQGNDMTRIFTMAACLAVAAALTSTSASAQSFGAKPGAWETTVTMAGMTIPPEVLAKMPPDRRAIVEQQLSANGGGQPTVRKICMTKEDLSKGFMPNPNTSCTVQTVSQTSTKLVMSTTCTAPVASTGTMSWEAKTPESVVGNVDQDMNGRKVHINIVGKWLGSSCEGVPPRPGKGG
jgi:hypothetical protein